MTENQKPLPFTLEGKNLRFFDGTPGIVRVSTGGREIVYSLTLPEAGDLVWKPAGVRTGIPRRTDLRRHRAISGNGWRCWALSDCSFDWFLFGRGARAR